MLASVEPKTIESRYGAPLLLLHRATLQRALLADGVEETVDTGSEVIRVDEEGDEILAETSEGTQLHGDLLIGADGLQSKVRSSLLGDDPLRHSGLLGYRATVEWKGPIKAGEYWGDGVAFGLVPIDGERVYWFATKRTRGGEPPEDDPIPGLIERFERWAPELISVISATPPTAVLRHDLYDRPPSTPWVQGRIALLGDAAHPMLPFLGQGACQAIEDAEVIGETLTTGSSVPNALKAYEKQRKPRATRAVRASRQMGRMIHLRPAPLRVVRDRVVSLTPEGMRLRQLDAVVGRP
jgi:2-polyprenyl-6-methoxyphenol hydroxylase-like FAD-dependent oxidoreductase